MPHCVFDGGRRLLKFTHAVGVLVVSGFGLMAGMSALHGDEAFEQGDRAGVRVVLRMDDMSALSDVEIEKKIVDRVRANGFSLTVGIIPFGGERDSVDLGEESARWHGKAPLLARWVAEGTIEPALHGYLHRACSTDAEGRNSEFANVALDVQRRKLQEGKAFLDRLAGRPVTVFVPPFNTCDDATLTALEETGFEILSADHRVATRGEGRLKYMPMTCFFGELPRAVEAARRMGRPCAIVALFHHYDFKEADRERGTMTFGQFDDTLSWLSRQKDVTVCGMSTLAADDSLRFDADTIEAYRRSRGRPPLVPGFAWKLDRRVLVPAPRADAMVTRSYIVGGAVYGVALVVCLVAGAVWIGVVAVRRSALAWGVLGLVEVTAAGGAVVMSLDGKVSFVPALALTAGVGLFVGGLVGRRLGRRRTVGAEGGNAA